MARPVSFSTSDIPERAPPLERPPKTLQGWPGTGVRTWPPSQPLGLVLLDVISEVLEPKNREWFAR